MSTPIENELVRLDLAEATGTLTHLTVAQTAILDRARSALMNGDSAGSRAVSLVLDRTLTIPVYAWTRVERDLARLIAKAQQRELPTPVLTELGRDEEYVTASILGGAPVFNGWSLVADLESCTLEDGTRSNIVRTARGRECPAVYRDAPEQCLHCGLDRRRNRTFVIEHEDGRVTQVGSTCLNEYLGTEALAAWLSWSRLEAATDGWAALGERWDAGEFAAYRGAVSEWGAAVPTAGFLAAVCAEARVHGFASSGSSLHPDLATGRQVWAAVQTSEHEFVTDGDIERAAEILDMIAAMTSNTDLAHNLRTIVASGRVEWGDANTIAAAYSIHARQEAQLNEYIPHAQVGDRVVLDLTVSSMPYFDKPNAFSYGGGTIRTWIVTMLDPAGRTAIWRTGSPNTCDQEGLEVGDRIRVTATVKAFGEYNGIVQTELTLRAASVRAPDEVERSAPAMRKWAKTRGFEVPDWALTKRQRKVSAVHLQEQAQGVPS